MENNNVKSTFGERVRERRKMLRMTQEELGQKTGYSKAGISLIETGQRDIDTETTMKFADALDVIPAYLMGWADEFGEITYGQEDPIESAIKSASTEDLFRYMQMITDELRRRK